MTSEVKTLEDKETEHRIAAQIIQSMKSSAKKCHCELCDRDIDDIAGLEERIRKAEAGLGALLPEESSMLRELKQRQLILGSMRYTSNKRELEQLERQLAAVTVEITDEERKLKAVREELGKHGDIADLSTAMKRNMTDLMTCLKKIDVLRDGERQVSETITENKSTLASLMGRLDRAATGDDMVIARKKASICEQIHSIFEEGIDAYRAMLKKEVERDATDLFVQITNDPDYVGLEITDTYGMNIIHKDGGDPVPLRSAGFEHIVALSLIGALHKNAPLSGPIVMDSPLGRLDPTHKANITRLLPQLAGQVVLLAYTHEIDEQLARSNLGSALRKEYRLTKQTSFNTRIEEERDNG